MAKEMTLELRILARAEEALKTLRKFEAGLTSMADVISRKYGVVSGTFGAIGKGLSLAFSPLKYAAAGALGLAGALTALGTKAIYAAAEDEGLVAQLEALYGSAEKARTKFRELEEISRFSPFDVESLVQANFALENYGLGGSKNLQIVAKAAKAANRDIGELALQVGAMQARGLKVFGIDMDTKGDKTIFSYRDRMQQIRRVVAAGAADARQKLLTIFDAKFGGKAPETFRSMFAGLRHTLDQAFAGLGEGLLPMAKQFVEGLRVRLVEMVKSGDLEQIGARVAQKLQAAWDYGVAALTWAKGVWESADWEGRVRALGVLFTGVAEIFVNAIVTYLTAAGTVFLGIGKIIASAFMEEALQLPGMGMLRKGVVASTAKQFSAEELAQGGMPKELAERIKERERRIAELTDRGIRPSLAEQKVDASDRMQTRRDFDRWVFSNPEQSAKLTGMSAKTLFASGVSEFTATLPGLGGKLVEDARATMARTLGNAAQVSGYTGPSIQQIYDNNMRNRAEAEDAAKLAGVDVAHMHRIERRSYTHGKGIWGTQEVGTGSADVPIEKGSWKTGERKTGGWVVEGVSSASSAPINVQTLILQTNDIGKLRNEILQAAGKPR